MGIMQVMESKHLRESDNQVLSSPYVYKSPEPFNGSKEVRLLNTLSISSPHSLHHTYLRVLGIPYSSVLYVFWVMFTCSQ